MYKCLECQEQFDSLETNFDNNILDSIDACVLCNSQSIILGKECQSCHTFTNNEDLHLVTDGVDKKHICSKCKDERTNND
jgi:DNA-binding Lrp family transcriptional regulator